MSRILVRNIDFEGRGGLADGGRISVRFSPAAITMTFRSPKLTVLRNFLKSSGRPSHPTSHILVGNIDLDGAPTVGGFQYDFRPIELRGISGSHISAKKRRFPGIFDGGRISVRFPPATIAGDFRFSKFCGFM